jgi:hypothetical protein
MSLQISQGKYTIFSANIFVGFRAEISYNHLVDAVVFKINPYPEQIDKMVIIFQFIKYIYNCSSSLILIFREKGLTTENKFKYRIMFLMQQSCISDIIFSKSKLDIKNFYDLLSTHFFNWRIIMTRPILRILISFAFIDICCAPSIRK